MNNCDIRVPNERIQAYNSLDQAPSKTMTKSAMSNTIIIKKNMYYQCIDIF